MINLESMLVHPGSFEELSDDGGGGGGGECLGLSQGQSRWDSSGSKPISHLSVFLFAADQALGPHVWRM